MLNKVNRTQQKIVNLLVFIGLLLSGKSFAQSCDPYIQKALEQTHITTFSKVSYGATAEFVIRYPLNDTKYTLTDQDGNTYVYRYSYSQPADEKVTIEIPVGVTTKERRFALKAENGLCTYTTSFDYTIKPISSVTHELAVRVEDEWCSNGGGIFFSVVGQGASNSDYDFYYKKYSDAAYPTSPLIAPKYEGLGAGIYDIKAVKRTAPHTTLTQQVTVRADNETDYLHGTVYPCPLYRQWEYQGESNLREVSPYLYLIPSGWCYSGKATPVLQYFFGCPSG